MINWNRLIRKTSHPRSLLAKIAAGYITVLLTVGCIIYIGIHEWREIRSIETNVRQINRQKRAIRNVYMKMLELSLFCDTFTEWDEKDFNTYLKQKSAVDSLLYGLQELHPNARIDSIRILWKDKEQSMLQIKEIMRKQQQAGREIAGQLPQTAGQSPPKKTGRKGGFLKRLFGKKEKTETSPDTSALHALNRTIADRQRQYARQFSEQAHILASRNRLLNEQLQQVIRHMDQNIQEEMQQREKKLGRTGERSLAIVAGLVVFMLLLLGGSYMIIHRDMARINRYKKRLEETIGQLEHTVAENEELIAARKRIMLTVTHDLRTPLTTINSYAELLATEKKISKRKEYNRTIRRVAGHMEAMLNTLLGFFRLESGKEEVNPVPFRLHTVIETLEADFMPLAADKNLFLNMESPRDRVVIGDKKRIVQIGHNLLSNAIKFTETGTIELSVWREGDWLGFRVTDTGIGIADEELRLVFNPFHQGDTTSTRRFDGTGLGLATTKKLAELMGGEVGVDSELHHGSVFWFTARLQRGISAMPTEEIIQSDNYEDELRRNYSGLKILLADDVDLNLEVAQLLLHGIGLQVDSAKNGREAVDKVRTSAYDLILMDVQMPRMDGLEATRLIRVHEREQGLKATPIIALTASVLEQDRRAAQTAGMNGFASKPLEMHKLTAEIARLLDIAVAMPPPAACAPVAIPRAAISDSRRNGSMMKRLLAPTSRMMPSSRRSQKFCARSSGGTGRVRGPSVGTAPPRITRSWWL